MPRPLFIQKVTETLRARFENFSPIRSAYLYGSVLTDHFSETSDIDVLFVVDDIPERNSFLKSIKAARVAENDFKIDVNIVFQSELLRRWHIYRPPTYFVWIKRWGLLLWGTDCLRDFSEKEITAESIYRRAVDLAQSSRSVYLNDKDSSFWEKKYVRWLRELVGGILCLQGTFELDFKLCVDKLRKASPEVAGIGLLQQDRLPIKTISEIAETLVVFVYDHYI